MIEYSKQVLAEDLDRMEDVQLKLGKGNDEVMQCIYWIAVAVWHILHYIRRRNQC